MAEAEQKIVTKSYIPQNYDKLTPYMKNAKGLQKKWMPEDLGKGFDPNCDHDTWVKLVRETGDSSQKAIKQWPSPDDFFKEKAQDMYKKTLIAPIEGKLACECIVFEPVKPAEDELMFIYVHGGGMAMFDGKDAFEWGPATYAMEGHIGATVLFTNSVDECYPRGLNDVISAIKYLSATYKDKVKGICVHGESGGANLIVAAMMKIKQEEPEKDYVDCLYIECPYLYPTNGFGEDTFATPEDIKGSIEEFSEDDALSFNESKLIGRALFLSYKGPDRDETKFLQDKFAWPYFATEDDFKNFPMTYVQSNECDVLKDIGLRLYRQLIGAGVKAFHAIESGTFHASEKQDLLYNRLVAKRRETFLKCILEQREQAKAS